MDTNTNTNTQQQAEVWVLAVQDTRGGWMGAVGLTLHATREAAWAAAGAWLASVTEPEDDAEWEDHGDGEARALDGEIRAAVRTFDGRPVWVF